MAAGAAGGAVGSCGGRGRSPLQPTNTGKAEPTPELADRTLEGQNPEQARQNSQEVKVEGRTMWVLHFQLKVGVGSAFFSEKETQLWDC